MLTRRVPAWVEEEDGKLVRSPSGLPSVKRIFTLAAGGHGHAQYCQAAHGRQGAGVRPRWPVDAPLRRHKILTGRAALGECQACAQGGTATPMVTPSPATFPPWSLKMNGLAARAAAAERLQKRGRVGRHVNPFAGFLGRCAEWRHLLRHQQEQGSRSRTRQHRVLRRAPRRWPASPTRPSSKRSRPCCKEIDPHDILNGDHGPDDSQVLAGELVGVEASIATIEAEMDANGESPVLFKRLRAKEERKRVLAKKLPTPNSGPPTRRAAAWGECQSLASVLTTRLDPDCMPDCGCDRSPPNGRFRLATCGQARTRGALLCRASAVRRRQEAPRLSHLASAFAL